MRQRTEFSGDTRSVPPYGSGLIYRQQTRKKTLWFPRRRTHQCRLLPEVLERAPNCAYSPAAPVGRYARGDMHALLQNSKAQLYER